MSAATFQLDDNFLQTLGLEGLPEEQKRAFLDHIQHELELRVGTTLSSELSDEQLEEFEALADENDSDRAKEWLESHCPNYKQVITREIETLKLEVIAHKGQILGVAPNS